MNGHGRPAKSGRNVIKAKGPHGFLFDAIFSSFKLGHNPKRQLAPGIPLGFARSIQLHLNSLPPGRWQVKKMDIRALLLVNAPVETGAEPLPVSSTPLALLEVAGMNALERTAERMHRYGIEPTTAVIDFDMLPEFHGATSQYLGCLLTGRERFWRIAESVFNDMVQNSAELVIIARLGAYAEIDFEKLVQFHLDNQCRVTQVSHRGQPLEIFCISGSRRNDAASLLRSQLTRCRTECPLLEDAGYCNPLNDARDLRQLAIDILTLKTESGPGGVQVRPGVWVEPKAVIEKGARVLAPAFIGARSRIRSHAVITRCSTVEHHAEVDCGTVAENSTVLPYSYVGAGLDLAHSVAGPGRIANLFRDASIEIQDRKLVGPASGPPLNRLAQAAVELATYVPRQIWQAMFGKAGERHPDLQTALHQTSPALGDAAGYQASACDSGAAGKFPHLAIMRRYGHQ